MATCKLVDMSHAACLEPANSSAWAADCIQGVFETGEGPAPGSREAS